MLYNATTNVKSALSLAKQLQAYTYICQHPLILILDQFETGLLEILLQDLLSRELDRDPHHPVYDAKRKTSDHLICKSFVLNCGD